MQSILKKSVLVTGLAASVTIMAMTGCQSTSDRTAGRQLDDRIVNSRVKDALEDSPVYKFPEVRVMTYGGVVQLSGFVTNEEQKSRAADLARKIEGVHEVINNISLKPTATGRESGYQQNQGSTQGQSTTQQGSSTESRKLDAELNAPNKAEKEGAPVRENK